MLTDNSLKAYSSQLLAKKGRDIKQVKKINREVKLLRSRQLDANNKSEELRNLYFSQSKRRVAVGKSIKAIDLKKIFEFGGNLLAVASIQRKHAQIHESTIASLLEVKGDNLVALERTSERVDAAGSLISERKGRELAREEMIEELEQNGE